MGTEVSRCGPSEPARKLMILVGIFLGYPEVDGQAEWALGRGGTGQRGHPHTHTIQR